EGRCASRGRAARTLRGPPEVSSSRARAREELLVRLRALGGRAVPPRAEVRSLLGHPQRIARPALAVAVAASEEVLDASPVAGKDGFAVGKHPSEQRPSLGTRIVEGSRVRVRVLVRDGLPAGGCR